MLLSLGLPVYSGFTPETVFSLLTALSQIKCPVHPNLWKGTYVHDARDHIVATAREVKATHLMFIDADMVFGVDAIPTLIDRDKDIIGGSYNAKSLPLKSTVKMADENGDFLDTAVLNAEPFRCAAVGTGFMLINLERLFAKWPDPPYFSFSTYKGSLMGEDVNFCVQARAKGLEVWCDPTIPLKHIGDYGY